MYLAEERTSVMIWPLVDMWNFISASRVGDSLEPRCTNTHNGHILWENMNNSSDFCLLIIYRSAHIVREMLDHNLI